MVRKILEAMENQRGSNNLFLTLMLSLKDGLWRFNNFLFKRKLPIDHSLSKKLNDGEQVNYIPVKVNKDYQTPRDEVSLPGSFWGVTCFYNPSHYKNKLDNYRHFRKKSQEQGLKLLCVELAFGDSDFELTKDDADILVQLRTDSVLWQKERLLNVGLKALPQDCDKFAWLDADILFENDNWVELTAQALESYKIVQPYSVAVRLPKNGQLGQIEDLPVDNSEGAKIYGLAYSIASFGLDLLSADYVNHGHAGFVWAARREIFKKSGLYDRMILGSGDSLMAHAFYGQKKYFIQNICSQAMVADQNKWMDDISREIGQSVYYVEGVIEHLWHGSKDNRFYNDRLRVLKRFEFNPASDIKLDKNGCWQWASDKPALHQWCKNYFNLRKESGSKIELTIVIPFKDRQPITLKRCLDSLQEQSFKDFKLILVDSGSRKEISQAVQDIVSHYSFARYVFTDTRGWPFNKANAINIGAKMVETKYIMTTDVDMIFPHNFLLTYMSNISEKKVLYCNHYFLPKRFNDWQGINRYFGKFSRATKAVKGACQCLPTEVFERVGGLDEYYSFWGRDDTDFTKRIKKIGLREVWLSSRTAMFHQWHSKRDYEKSHYALDHINGIAIPYGLWSRKCVYFLRQLNKVRRNNDNWGQIIKSNERLVFKFVDLKNKRLIRQDDLTVIFFPPELNRSVNKFVNEFLKLKSGQAIAVDNAFFPRRYFWSDGLFYFLNGIFKVIGLKTKVNYQQNLLHAFLVELTENNNQLIADYYLNLDYLNGVSVFVKK